MMLRPESVPHAGLDQGGVTSDHRISERLGQLVLSFRPSQSPTATQCLRCNSNALY